jgi:hypothetical protein
MCLYVCALHASVICVCGALPSRREVIVQENSYNLTPKIEASIFIFDLRPNCDYKREKIV